MSDKLKYELRGVSASKSEVHAAIKGLDKGLFPTAFCKILPDVLSGADDHVNIMHADTAGTKTSLAYMYWKETGRSEIWEGIVQDSIVMNIDDMACVGCVDNIILSSTIGRNKNLIPGEVIKTIIHGAKKFVDQMRAEGVNMHLSGGETADVGDIVRTLDVGFTTFARMAKKDLIVNKISDGNVIVGFSSSGQTTYEERYNSGIGSNGLTSARHDVLDKSHLVKYPDSYDSNTPEVVLYNGTRKLTDNYELEGREYVVGDLLLSPTRSYLPVLKEVLSKHHQDISGIIHCTGGAQTKVLKFTEQVHIIKDDLFEIPPVFRLIQEEADTPLREMYQVFNMGHRMEIYCSESAAASIIAIANNFELDAKIIGTVEKSDSNKLSLTGADGKICLLYTSPSPRDATLSRMPSSA